MSECHSHANSFKLVTDEDLSKSGKTMYYAMYPFFPSIMYINYSPNLYPKYSISFAYFSATI